jgi:CBS domain-containing protein
MSPRAAWRLERLGFGPVFDYSSGKLDWLAAGLPGVRADRSQPRALDALDPHPPTCAPDSWLRDVAVQPERSLIVLNEHRIVLGRVPRSRFREAAKAEDAMEPGPTTVRAHEALTPLLERMHQHHVSEMIVTTPEGQLLGVIYASESATFR